MTVRSKKWQLSLHDLWSGFKYMVAITAFYVFLNWEMVSTFLSEYLGEHSIMMIATLLGIVVKKLSQDYQGEYQALVNQVKLNEVSTNSTIDKKE